MSTQSSGTKFDPARASEYAEQSRIALAGYDACHELAACLLVASIKVDSPTRILVVGVGGTAQEILTAAPLEPTWKFTAVDPSQPMLDLTRSSIAAAGFGDRVELIHGYVDDLSADTLFDGATLIGVLHHLPGAVQKAALLKAISTRLKPNASLIVAGNYRRYAEHPQLLEAWGQRWRMKGASPDEVKLKLGKILEGADPPESEEVVVSLLADAGFTDPLRFFSSLFWGAWIARRTQ